MIGRLKSAWHALRGYAAASDLRASTWAPSSGSANAEVAGAAATVARRAAGPSNASEANTAPPWSRTGAGCWGPKPLAAGGAFGFACFGRPATGQEGGDT